MIAYYIQQIMNIPLFLNFHMFKGDNRHISSSEKNFNIGFFLDTIKARSFKLCMLISLLGVYIVLLGLITLILFQGHRYVRSINCKSHVLDSCPLQFKRCMVAYIKIMHKMICVTGVYLREIIDMFFADQVSGLVENFQTP